MSFLPPDCCFEYAGSRNNCLELNMIWYSHCPFLSDSLVCNRIGIMQDYHSKLCLRNLYPAGISKRQKSQCSLLFWLKTTKKDKFIMRAKERDRCKLRVLVFNQSGKLISKHDRTQDFRNSKISASTSPIFLCIEVFFCQLFLKRNYFGTESHLSRTKNSQKFQNSLFRTPITNKENKENPNLFRNLYQIG